MRPTVISHYLEGRKARYLPVPSYKCELGGRVVVDIEVLDTVKWTRPPSTWPILYRINV